jgi:hypothetical protein
LQSGVLSTVPFALRAIENISAVTVLRGTINGPDDMSSMLIEASSALALF